MNFLMNLLFPPRTTAKIVDASSYEDLSKEIRVGIFTTVHYVLPYKSVLVQAFIQEAKFHESKKARMYLGKVLAQYLTATFTNAVLIPLPLGKKRLRERGYNQVTEIAKCAQPVLPSHIRIDPDLLMRTKETKPQTTLGREERLLNMKDVFKATRALDADTLYIVLDDVVTTGASLLAAKAALLAAGARNVALLALAH